MLKIWDALKIKRLNLNVWSQKPMSYAKSASQTINRILQIKFYLQLIQNALKLHTFKDRHFRRLFNCG